MVINRIVTKLEIVCQLLYNNNIIFIMYKKCFKRMLDLIMSFLLIILLTPLFVIIPSIIFLSSKGSPIFKQERIGMHGKTFVFFKFRTMFVGSEKDGVYSNDKDKRVTRFGRFLRKTSLDELPQLFNIFVGQMSFVGPRPPLIYHPWLYEDYTEEQRHMFSVRPGLTGWAQIHGRKEVEWRERIQMNVWYVNNVSFFLDTKIFFITFLKVLRNDNNENNGRTI